MKKPEACLNSKNSPMVIFMTANIFNEFDKFILNDRKMKFYTFVY